MRFLSSRVRLPWRWGAASLAMALALSVALVPTAAAQTGDAVTFSQEGLQPANPAARGAPDVYVVQVGDTLWDISTKFLGNPYHWPELWSINDHITNPHWIYPGNRIIFVPGTEIEPPGISLEGDSSLVREGYLTETMTFEEGDWTCGPDVRFTDEALVRDYRAPGYLEDRQEMEIIGELYRARTGQKYLGQYDLVYLEMEDPDRVECGDVVSIIRRDKKKVRHPERRRIKYGGLYRIIGNAQVLHVQDDVAMAVVRSAFFEAERGDLVAPRIPVEVELSVDKPRGSLEGVIVARLGEWEFDLASIEETVFLDRGKADGVRVGNTFYVVHRRDEGVDMDADNPRLPPSVTARLVVVRVDETSSTAVVVDASRRVEVGNRVTQLVE